MLSFRICTLVILILLSFVTCTNGEKRHEVELWYAETKQAILRQANIKSDSAFVESYIDGRPHILTEYSKGRPVVKTWYRETGERVGETHYSSDGTFELRREIWPNGHLLFEGIFYKGNAYGPSAWWSADSLGIEEGVRYNNERVGIWRKKDINGKENRYDFGHTEYLDSILLIKIKE
jgi:hypothetical protein